jgi:protein-L-isoaspartate(D-aspartate) O-methyltransferase
MRSFLTVAFLAGLAACGQDDSKAERERMVREDIASRDIRNPDVLKAMRATPRHLFVPPALRMQAYADHPLPIGHGQTISQPYIVALMTELLEPDKSHKVLEIGTGSGYQAAVLASLVRHVYSIEIVPELARSASDTLKHLGYANVTVRHGDGYLGWPEEAPFDRIVVTAAPPELPKALVDQLKPGGRIVAPVGRTVWTQDLVVVEKGRDGKLKERSVIPVRFVPMVPGKRR